MGRRIVDLPRTLSIVVTAAKFVVALATCAISGVVWAVVSVAGRAAADGYPPEYYDAGNRFAFSVALMFLLVLCPGGSLAAYGLTRFAGWSTWRSVAAAQLGAAVFAAPVFALFAWG